MSEDADQLDLFVSLYDGVDELTPISDAETKAAVEQCLRFLMLCAEGKMAPRLDPSTDVHSLALTIHGVYDDLEQIRVFVLTDRVAKSKSFKTLEIGPKSVRLEVMDIERLHRHWSEGKPRDELVVNFEEVSGAPLPCVFVPGAEGEYDYALTAIPGEALRFVYEKYGTRLLEANVRSFLSVKGKGVNAGIQNTLTDGAGELHGLQQRHRPRGGRDAAVAFPGRLAGHRLAQGDADRQRRADHGLALFREEELSRDEPLLGAGARENHRHEGGTTR